MSTDWSENILISDLSDEPALSDELSSIYDQVTAEGRKTPHVVLDLSSVTYLNSSNIAQMLRLRKRLTESDRRLIVSSVADPVWSVMLLTGLDKVFTFTNDKATAIASLQIESGEP